MTEATSSIWPLVLTAVSTLAALGSAIAAFKTISISRTERLESLKADRPYLSVKGGRKLEDEANALLTFVNVGKRPLKDLRIKIYLLRQDDCRAIKELDEISSANETLPNFESHLKFGCTDEELRDPSFIVVGFRYLDPMLGRICCQRLFLKHSGEPHILSFANAGLQEVDRIRAALPREFLTTFQES